MGDVIKKLIIALGIDSSKVDSGMKKADKSVNVGVKSMISTLGKLAAGFGAAVGSAQIFGDYLNQADQIGKLSDALGLNVEDVYAWSEAAARAGGSAEAFQGTLKNLNSQIAFTAKTGQGRLKAVFDSLGISVKDSNGRAREAFDIMSELAAKAETMGKAEFVGLAQRLGLDEGTVMLLQQGRAAVTDAVRRQRELGVYTKEDARVTAEFNDRMDDFGQVLRTTSAIIFRIILPAFTAVVNGMTNAINFVRKHERFFIMVMGTLSALMLKSVVPATYAWIKANMALAASFMANPVYLSIALIVAAVVGLIAIIDDLFAYMEGGKSLFAKFWSLFGPPETIKKAWTDLVAWIQGKIDWMMGIGQKFKAFFGFGGDVNVNQQPTATDAISPAISNNKSQINNNDTQVSVGEVKVITQATDANGISKDISRAIKSNTEAQFDVDQYNVGVVQ